MEQFGNMGARESKSSKRISGKVTVKNIKFFFFVVVVFNGTYFTYIHQYNTINNYILKKKTVMHLQNYLIQKTVKYFVFLQTRLVIANSPVPRMKF